MHKWTGGCLCGAVRYEANFETSENWYCHCKMCQRWSGSAVSTDAIIKKHELVFTKGEPKYYQSSSYADRGFCVECGSSLVFRATTEDWLSIQTGSLDDPNVAPPTGHYSIEGKVDWLAIDERLPKQRTEEDEWQQKNAPKE